MSIKILNILVATLVVLSIPFLLGDGPCDGKNGGNTGNTDSTVLNPVPWENQFHFLTATFDGPATLHCTGSNFKWEDRGVFIPHIKLNEGPAKGPLTLSFDIQGAKDIGSDWLGYLEASWNTGDTYARSFRYPAKAPNSDAVQPDGAVTITNGFWLGCTANCAVRGNAGHTGTSRRAVFLRSRGNNAQITNNFDMKVGCSSN
jgi:hypothetical protein